MLTNEMVDRLRKLQGGGHPVLSLYLGLRPGVGSLREFPIRLKDLLTEVERRAADLPRDDRRSLEADVRAVRDSLERVSGDLGRGVAIFRCAAVGIDEYLSLPMPVRDRAIVNDVPYLRPLYAMLEQLKRYAVVVVDRRVADILRFNQGQLEAWEEMAEEEIRKANWGGHYGLEEHRVRNHAEEVAQRHYREIAARLYEAWKEPDGYDLLIVGGHDDHVRGLVDALHPDLRGILAGTFVVDPGTMTPSTVLEKAAEVAEAWEHRAQAEEVTRLIDTAYGGGPAALGIPEVLRRVNERAVDTLLVQGQRLVPGARCPGDGWLVTEGAGRCPICGGSVEPVPDLLDAMVEAVLAASGKVTHVLTETPLAEYEVGAFLRYKLEQAV